ncbi:hypothetical protein MRX96_032107 [Rhipicephalus microplus]
MQRVDTTMREAILVEKRVAVSLYRLCSAAEDRSIAELFAIGRSTVNLLYKEFYTAVLKNLEDDWVKMPSPTDMEEHMRELFAVTGFPQGVGGARRLPLSSVTAKEICFGLLQLQRLLAVPQLLQLALVTIHCIAEGFPRQVQLSPPVQLLQFALN